MIHDLYTSLTAREQRANRWSAAASAAALWLATAWADPRFLLIVPLAGAGFWFYRRDYRDEPAADDPDWDLADRLRGDLQVADERCVFLLAAFGVAAQDRARVDRGEHVLGEVGLDRLAALPRDAKLPAEQRLGSGRAEADEHPRLDRRELAFQPRPAGLDLGPRSASGGCGACRARPLEVLDHVGDVDRLAVDAGVDERLVEELSPRARRTGGPACPPGRRAAHRRTSRSRPRGPRRRRPASRSSRGRRPCSRPPQPAVRPEQTPHARQLPGIPRDRESQRYDDRRGAVAEWSGRGLQSLAHQFDSGRRLYLTRER